MSFFDLPIVTVEGSGQSKGETKRFDETKGFDFIMPDNSGEGLFVHPPWSK